MSRKCIGFLGVILGHKFKFFSMSDISVYTASHCMRCGMPAGGWTNGSN